MKEGCCVPTVLCSSGRMPALIVKKPKSWLAPSEQIGRMTAIWFVTKSRDNYVIRACCGAPGSQIDSGYLT